MKNEYSFEVRGYELDSFNHVNNAVYIRYLEQARWKFFNDTKWLDYMRSNSLQAIVIETNIRYIRELNVFDKAVVKSKWHYEGDYLVAKQDIYLEDTNKKAAKAIVKMLFVSTDRIVHEIPDFITNELDTR
ncbi:MAG: thioesterase family protein [Halanaerobiales bacterium]|nr:thioesterase family protein [Halanaerobiales bacterium]